MVICSKCQAENRPEAAFCVRCGAILLAQSTPSKSSIQHAATETHEETIQSQPSQVSAAYKPMEQSGPNEAKTETTHIIGFQSRSQGSILGDRFQCDAPVFQDEHEIHYTATEITQPDTPSVRICSNMDCRTIHCPVGTEVEKYCTQCGHPLVERSPLFLLQEADTDKYDSVQPLIDLHLIHPNIHPPIAAFPQDASDGVHYCLVTPYSNDLPAEPEISVVLDWGVQLAQALDYMQSKGIAIGEEFHPSSIGLTENKVVWRDFSAMRVLPILTDREKVNNFRQLVLSMYAWITGRNDYQVDPYLPSALNDLFERALVGDGFLSGVELIQQIEMAKADKLTRLILDFQVGRHTHPGISRTLNEDSLFCLELTSICQGNIQPAGLFAIADGMGGHASGEQASGLVVQTIAHKATSLVADLQDPSAIGQADWLKRVVEATNQAVYEARKKAGNDMGSTLVIGLLSGTQAYLAHIGDSRIYLVNQHAIQQLTTDHSLVQHLVSTGQISADEARYHPQRNVIYRSLGEKSEVEVDYFNQQLFHNDRLLLCSDGITSMLDDQTIQKIILEAESPQSACEHLIKAANSAGGEDNSSVIIIEVISV